MFPPKQKELNNTNIEQDDSVKGDTRVGSAKTKEIKEERKKLQEHYHEDFAV